MLCTILAAAFSTAEFSAPGFSAAVEVSLTHGPAPGRMILDIVRRVLLVGNRLKLSKVFVVKVGLSCCVEIGGEFD